MIQAPEPPAMDVIVTLVKLVGAPTVMFFGFVWVFRRLLLPKQNGAAKNDADKEKREALQHLDLTLTTHFDQLRRDLSTTVERQHELSRDDMRNALSTMLMEMELGRLRAGDKR
jgi:hypothetical protein